MTALEHIFLDLDGVLADFVTAAAHLHGRPDILSAWPLGTWDMHAALGMSSGAFWGAIDRAGCDFWAGLEPFPWTFELFDRLRDIAPVTISSSPSYDPHCLAGKIHWLQRLFGRRFRDFMIGPQKHLLARPGAALIDDNERNVREFTAHGGHGILFPQPWNANHPHTEDRVGFVLEAVRQGAGVLSEGESP